MEFLQLPPEVNEGVLLPFLKWNDLLRLRRVCKTTKNIINHYLQVDSALAPEMEINEEDKTFGNFLEMGIPTQKIYLQNTSGYEFYDKDRENLALFLERHGGSITSLRVDQLSIFVFGNELEFLDTLVKVQELVVGHICYGCNKNSGNRCGTEISTCPDKYFAQLNPADRQSRQRCVIPKFMKQLKVLYVERDVCHRSRIEKAVERLGLVYWEENEATLEHVLLPFTPFTESGAPLPVPFTNYSTAMEARASANWDTPKVKIIDFVNCHVFIKLQRVVSFLNLCDISVRLGAKLKNVSPFWFIDFGEDHEQNRLNSPQLGIPVLSLKGLDPCVLGLEMPNLERIEIGMTAWNSVGPHWRGRRPEWPALKELDITVNSPPGETESLFRFLFQDVVRENMTELRFRFEYSFMTDEKGLAVPNTRDIVRSCPNLKKLMVNNWPGTNKQLTELFEGLAQLEEVTLEDCRDLENVAFVGRNTRRPVFLNLAKLRKLSLRGLNQMPKINDVLFTRVIRHLPLSHLTLTSRSPLKSVSIKGIEALLEGAFAESIEKFPFQDFFLKDVSAHEFKMLEQQFRSFNML